MTKFHGFPSDTRRFLVDLSQNNNREWFAENKPRYEESFLQPALEFIAAMEKPLEKAAPLLLAEPKRSGGSLMRIYKDTRFSKDKTPYKLNIGIHFRHRSGRDVHAPGVYFHLGFDECFFGAGIWRSPSSELKAIRQAIVDDPAAWQRATSRRPFTTHFEVHDDRLKTAPRGFDRDHPQLDDLRLKSHLGMAPLPLDLIESDELVPTLVKKIKAARPLMTFLCEALGLPY